MRDVLVTALTSPADVVEARRRTHALASEVGLEAQDANRLATAVSELARVAFARSGTGRVVCSLMPGGRRGPEIVVGVSPLTRAMTVSTAPRRLRDAAGALDLAAVGRLVDRVTWIDDDGLEVARAAPRRRGTTAALAEAVAAVTAEEPVSPLAEIERQNRQLMAALSELQQRQGELLMLNAELEDTNRGISALHHELADQAAELRRSDAGRRRLLHVVAHETRTPLYAIRGLVEVLRDLGGPQAPLDADLALIDDAARDALGVVDEALEVSRAVAGKMLLEFDDVALESLFSSLRGMLRPLQRSAQVELVVDASAGPPVIRTDPGKLATILRNLVGNALKFTPAGEVRLTSAPGDGMVRFVVADTGVGIDPVDHERIFADFEQVAGAQAGALGGTGLGLPLVRRLAEVLGGTVTLESALGAGSRFVVELPTVPPGRTTAITTPADGR